MAKDQLAEKSDTTSMVIHREFAKQVKAIADHRGWTMAEVLDRFAGPVILREFRKALQEMQEQVLGGEGG